MWSDRGRYWPQEHSLDMYPNTRVEGRGVQRSSHHSTAPRNDRVYEMEITDEYQSRNKRHHHQSQHHQPSQQHQQHHHQPQHQPQQQQQQQQQRQQPPQQQLSSSKHADDDLCVICGDRASGYHYNALSCEGCKGFFRRSITRNLTYECKYGDNCEMDMWMRRKCPACRLKRCRYVGMREECLLSERQCIARNFRRKTKKQTGDNTASKKSTFSPESSSCASEKSMCGGESGISVLDQLSEEHRELIRILVELQDKYELPKEEDIKQLSMDLKTSESTASSDMSDAIFLHMVEMTILVTRLIVDFAKCLPGFKTLHKDDQIVLLKASSSEVMMLRTARRYDPETNTVVFGDGTPFTSTSMAFGGLQGYVDIMFDFSKGMSSLFVDNAEYSLLTAMCIFSSRPGLVEPQRVDRLQEVYADVLMAYVKRRRSHCRNFLAKLLMKLVVLRSLSSEHCHTLYNLKIERGSLPPLLTEYFDIQE